ncbi:MAG: ammonium transporter [Spirochaetales bacterium]|nr:ammonium transporter [Leptospiraceae bacterium]MCP5483837.1 ammonium transporter [Spirochaetales bacterium]MCP5486870.1 ammonium transporter [Spirochaetales bacterium]
MEKSIVDVLWVLLCAGLVFVMQPGFACLEAGLTRSKNSINVAVKNITDVWISILLFWCVGYGLMFGESFRGFVGLSHFAALSTEGSWQSVFFLFQAMFCATACTIVSGAVAERVRYSSYMGACVFVSLVVYPVFGHWAWNTSHDGPTGWLAALGFHDFAGGSVVHSVGAWVGLAGVLVLGPRAGRFDHPGRNDIPPSSLVTAVLGGLLLVLGWFGFNGGSTYALDERVAPILTNTMLAGGAGSMVAAAVSFRAFRYWDPRWLINGMLAGLVSITACCNVVNSAAAIVIGGVGGIVMHFGDQLLVRLKLDDAVGAIPVHGFAGVWGTLSVAIFGDPVLLGTDAPMLVRIGTQLFGILTCFAWTFGAALAFFWILNRWSPMRVSAEAEKIGLNIAEHRATTATLDLYQEMDHQARTGDLSLRASVEPFTEVGQIAERYNLVMDSLESASKQMGRELNMARQIQRQLLRFNVPAPERARIQSRYIALSEVGGDLLDYCMDPEGRFGMLIADASGHGVPAALVGSMAKIAMEGSRSEMQNPVAVLRSLNQALTGRIHNHFLTACYALFDPGKLTLRYSIAGHPPPILIRSDGTPSSLEGSGPMLGILDQPRLSEWGLQLEPGDRVLLLTDGILECRSPDGRELQDEQLLEMVRRSAQNGTRRLLDRLLRELRRFTGTAGFEDDATLVLLSVV